MLSQQLCKLHCISKAILFSDCFFS